VLAGFAGSQPCSALRALAWAARLSRTTRRKDNAMLRIYFVMLDVIRLMRPVVTQIDTHDRELGKQLRQAENSVVLNTAEGSGSHGGTRLARYRTALGSAKETWSCIDAAEAQGYVRDVDPKVREGLRQVIGTLVNVTR
jgi:four helix bundle protein